MCFYMPETVFYKQFDICDRKLLILAQGKANIHKYFTKQEKIKLAELDEG